MTKDFLTDTEIPLECLNNTLIEIDKIVRAHEDILASSQRMFRMYIQTGKTNTEALNLVLDLNRKCANKASENNKGGIQIDDEA